MPLRLAMLTSFALNRSDIHGGVDTVARTLAFGLAARGDVEVHIISSRYGIERSRVERPTERLFIHLLPRFGRFELATLFMHDRWHIGRLLRELRPDVVHSQELGRYGFVCRSLGYPYVLTVHGIGSLEQRIVESAGARARARQIVLRWVEQSTWRGAGCIIANSTYVQRLVPGRTRQRVELIANPVDPIFFATEATRCIQGRITWVGRLSKLKGVDVLLRAMPRVRGVVPTAHARLVGPRGGDAAYLAELQGLTERAGQPGTVEFVGERHGQQLRAEYAAASVLVQPSRQDNVPMAIAEAMAVGRPVVATRVGGIPDLVADGVTGKLVEPDDDEELAHSLSALLVDETSRASLGSAARTAACARFNADIVAERHAELYKAVAA
jgi:glycosyltransferase involved in cell wall biosynthesis